MTDPAEYGLSDSAAAALRTIYCDEKKSIRESVQRAQYRTGEHILESSAADYIRANGWTRSRQYYARRSIFSQQNEANFREAEAKRSGRL
jgi:hypothetical protein